MKKSMKNLVALGILALLVCTFCSLTAYATSDDTGAIQITAAPEDVQTEENATGSKAVAAAVCVGIVAATAAMGMSIAIAKSADGISRQPEAAGSIRSSLMLGLVFIETAIIYALIIAILIVFVL